MSSTAGMNFYGRSIRSSAFIGGLMGLQFAIVTDLFAEQVDDLVATATSSQSVQQAGVVRSVKIEVKDTTLRFVLHEIAKVSGQQVVFSGNIPQLDRKVSLTLNEPNALAAVKVAIRGTGLTATVAKDGKTIVVLGRGVAEDSTARKESGVVKGRVYDENKKPVGGAAVEVSGVNKRAVTDANGYFEIRNIVSGKHDLVVKLIGYKSERVAINVSSSAASDNSQPDVTILLTPSATYLNEVVTTASGTQRRIEVGNDIVKINAAELLARAPARSVSDMIRFAQVPGVRVTTASGEPGSPTRIRMRGIGSISQNSDPAIIVDGIWINSTMSDSSVINSAWGPARSSGERNLMKTNYAPSPIDAIDPATIETLEFVRGPSAASLYGQEAANGVIVITTKKGKQGPTSWTYTFSRDLDVQPRAKQGSWLGYGTDPTGNLYTQECNAERHYQQDCFQDSVVDINRMGYLLNDDGNGSLQNHRVSVRGGNNKTAYSFSTAFQDNIGTQRVSEINLIRARKLNIPITNNFRHPGRKKDIYLSSSISFIPTQSLTIDVVANTNNSNLKQAQIETNDLSVVRMMVDTLAGMAGEPLSFNMLHGGSDVFSINSAVNLAYQSKSWWFGRGTIGADIAERKDYGRNDYRSCALGVCIPAAGSDGMPTNYRLRDATNSNKVLTGRISAGGKLPIGFDRFLTLTPSIGLDVKRSLNRRLQLDMKTVPFGSDQGSGEGAGTVTSNDVVTAGYFFTTAFGVLNRIYFNLGFRQDAGSVIKRNSASTYPKLSTSWIVSDEGFFPKNTFISGLSFRGAVGYAAVHPDAADINGGYQYVRSVIGGEVIWIAELKTVGNNKLVPERSLELEGGFDAYLWGDRAQLIFTVANKNLNNAIINRSIPPSSGVIIAARRKENISRVQNRSVELSFNTRVIDNDYMLLQLGTNISNVNNVIRKLGSHAIVSTNTSKDRLVEGYSISSVWDRPVLGYGDVNGNGYLDDSEIILGDTTVYKGVSEPKYTASYNGSVAVLNRNLSFSFSLSHRGPSVQYATYHDNYGEMVVGAPLELQVRSRANKISGGTALSTSEVRLSSASVNYNLPASFSQRLKSKLIVLSLQGSNLALWTSYEGRDPMVNSSPIGNKVSDNGYTLPIPRKYAFNVRVEL